MTEEKEHVEPAADEAPRAEEAVVAAATDEESPEIIETGKGIAELRENLRLATQEAERERQRRVEFEKLARERTALAEQAQMRAVHTEYQSLQDGIAFLKSRDARLIDEWKDAKSMGDYAREAELQRDWLRMQEDMRALEHRRAAMENFLRSPPPAAPVVESDPFEAWVSGPNVSAPTAEWARKHRNLFKDEDSVSLVRAAHFKAVGNGYRIDSAAYFRAVEEELGLTKKAAAHDDASDPLSGASDRVESTRRAPPPPAAPVSRGGSRKGTIHLTNAEKEAAEISGVSYEEYHRQKQRILEGSR